MTFGETLRQLVKTAAASSRMPQRKYITPRMIHRIGWENGVVTQGNPSFDRFAKRMVGTPNLREMNQVQLQRLARAMTYLKGSYSTEML